MSDKRTRPDVRARGATSIAYKWRVVVRAGTAVAATLPLLACTSDEAALEDAGAAMTATLSASAEAPAAASAVDLGAGFVPAIRAAVRQDPGFRAAEGAAVEAVQSIGVARAALRPQLSANANLGAIQETIDGDRETTTGGAGGLDLSQLVYDGGESAAAIRQAAAEALAARAERDVVANERALEAARAWIDAWQFDARLALLRGRTGQMDALMTQMERMASSGLVDRAALDAARRQIVDIRLEERRLRAEREDARTRLARFFGDTPPTLERPSIPQVVTAPEAATEAGTDAAPDVVRRAAELLVAESAVAQAEAAFRPKATLRAGVTSPIEESESTDVTLGLGLNYTFNDGGRRQATLEAARTRRSAAESRLSDARSSLESELATTRAQLASVTDSLPLVARQIELSTSEAKTARSQIATGQSNLRQLVEAEIEAYRARDRHIALRAERDLLRLTIAARTGALARRLELTPAAAD
jgi:outer membrane protein TolC